MKRTHDSLMHPGLRHGFFSRRGGVSHGLYDSLNCGLRNDDNPAHVAENRTRVAASLDLPGAALTSLWQVHGKDVVHVTAPFAIDERPKADAMVTATPGIALGVLSADCAPLLFHDPVHRVIGAAHSGWKGTLLNIGRATLEAMEQLGARRQDVIGVIGPCIAKQSYEVGPTFPAPFLAADAGAAAFFTPSPTAGHFMFDLPGYIAHQLRQAGIGQISAQGDDTYKCEDYFSNRRATHRSEPGFGLQISAISLI